MFKKAYIWLTITSVLLVLLTLFPLFGASFIWMYLGTTAGIFIFLFAVYRVLKAPYHSEKTFEDFYEDHSVNNED